MASATTSTTASTAPTKAAAQLTPQQRAANFSLATRQYIQSAPGIPFSEGQTVSYTLPKARFLQKITLQVSGTFVAKHATKTTFTPSVFDRYNLLNMVRLSINAGFNPYQISGAMLALYNKINSYKSNFLDGDVFQTNVMQNACSPTGATNNIQFSLELPITINDRDAIGLIMLQDDTTVVQLQIDCATLIQSIMTDTDVVTSAVNITINPVLETYSIPSVATAVPDYSVLKMVNQQLLNVVSAGEMTISLQTALTYRKLFVYIAQDTKMTPMPDANISKFQLLFNQADTPYSVSNDYLTYENKKDYQGQIPLGCYVFDFSNQGIANYGGAKDYIDCERMTQFDLKVTFANIVGNSNYIYVVGEKLARLS
jgi:hypothetical protein